MPVFCGIDWAEDHHDVALVDDTGVIVSRRRIADDADGFTQLLQLLAAHQDSAAAPIPVAIETPRGLLVACLRSTGRPVYAVLARAQQDAVWNRQQITNQLRSVLREYYPAFLAAFQDHRPDGLAHPDARAVLAAAPTPTRAAQLNRKTL